MTDLEKKIKKMMNTRLGEEQPPMWLIYSICAGLFVASILSLIAYCNQ